jgi:hypothetical protein
MFWVPEILAYSAVLYFQHGSTGYGPHGKSDHEDNPCPNPTHCVNCDSKHPSVDSRCPFFVNKKDIQKLKVKEHPTFLEAQELFLETKPKMVKTSLSVLQ